MLPGSVLGYKTLELDFNMTTNKGMTTIKVEIYNDSVAVIKNSNVMYALPNGFRQIIGF